MPDRAARAEHYRDKAEETRTVAESMRDATARGFLMGVSSDYLLLARALDHMQDPIPASE